MSVLRTILLSLAASSGFATLVFAFVRAGELGHLPRFSLSQKIERHVDVPANELVGAYGQGELVLAPGSRFRQGVRIVFCGFGDPDGPGEIDHWIEGTWSVDRGAVVLDSTTGGAPAERLEIIRENGCLGLVLEAGLRTRALPKTRDS